MPCQSQVVLGHTSATPHASNPPLEPLRVFALSSPNPFDPTTSCKGHAGASPPVRASSGKTRALTIEALMAGVWVSEVVLVKRRGAREQKGRPENTGALVFEKPVTACQWFSGRPFCSLRVVGASLCASIFCLIVQSIL